MSYWSHNPELYDEIITEAVLNWIDEGRLPGISKESIEEFDYSGDLLDFIEKQFGTAVMLQVVHDAESGYWSGKIDEATDRAKYDGVGRSGVP